ncbi:MAG: hypothetical protein PHS36_06505 [Candidatus Cloacimonetes bacterium]|nr:hypothetical protein [Candidatus Cloacimonadota bacterium]
MAVSKIVQLGLESRAKALKESGKSLDDMSFILSNEAKQKISKSCLFRYFETNKIIVAQAIEKQDKLKAVVAEAEISTISQRQQVIDGLLTLATNAENEHARVLAFKAANDALDSLDKRLGKLTGNSGVTINNINAVKLADLQTEQLLRMINVTT